MATFQLVDSGSVLYRDSNSKFSFILPRRLYTLAQTSNYSILACSSFVKHLDYAFNRVYIRSIPPDMSIAANAINDQFFRDENNVVQTIYAPSSDSSAFLELSNIPDTLNIKNFILSDGGLGFGFYSDDDFETDLYPELLDNEETKLSLQDWIDDDGEQRWATLTDKDIKAMELIEKYNKNVLLLRSTRKVNIENTVSTASSSGSSVNLVGVENKLQNINNSLDTLNDKFEVEEQVDGDVEIKSLTQVVKDLDLSNQTVITTVESAPYNPLLSDGDDIYDM